LGLLNILFFIIWFRYIIVQVKLTDRYLWGASGFIA